MNTLRNDGGLPSSPKQFENYVNIFQTQSNSLLRNLANLRQKLVQLSLLDWDSTHPRCCLDFSIHRLLLFLQLCHILQKE